MDKWNPEDYHHNSSVQLSWARELITKLDLKGDERILDIGCGDGKITASIASTAPNGSVLGIDSSHEMISFAESKFPTSKFPNLTFQCQDATQLNFHNEFDVIVSFACLHWISDQLSVLEGIKSSLKPNGKILLQMGGTKNVRALRNAIEKVIYSDLWSNYFQDFSFNARLYGDDEYQDLLARVGLKAKRVELVPKDAIHQGREGLRAWIRTTGTPQYIWRVPSDLHQNIIDEIVDTYIHSNPLDSAGLVHVPTMRLEVEATKIA